MSRRRDLRNDKLDQATSTARLDRSPPASPRRRAWLLCIVIIAAGLLAYANSFSGVFLFDDDHAILENPHIRRLWPLSEALKAPPQSTVAGRPVVSLSLAVNYALGGLNPWGYHAFNLAVHLAAGLVLFGVVRRTLLSDRLRERYGSAAETLAGITTLLWVVHPLQTETVTYVIQRTESMMALLYLLTLYCVMRGRSSARPIRWHVAGLVACGLGMATKEVMATAPLVVLLHDAIFGSGSIRGALRSRPWLYGGMAGTWAILAAFMVSAPRSASVGFSLGVTAFQYALNQCEVIVGYLRLVFWPHPLVLDYGHPREMHIGDAAPYAVVLACVLALSVVAFVRWPALGFWGAWFFLILGPTSSVVPITTEVAAERRMYLPLAGVLVPMVLGIYESLGRLFARWSVRARWRRLLMGGPALVAACLMAMLTIQRNAMYHNEEAMWRATLALQPGNPRVLVNLGKTLAARGEFDAAMECYRQSLQKDPDFPLAHYNLGNAFHRKGKYAEALAEYKTTLRLAPDFFEARNNVGVALVDMGRYQEAISHYLQILKDAKDIQVSGVHCNLAVALAKAGRPAEAITHLRESLRSDPEDDILARHNLAGLLLEQGRPREAVEQFRELLRNNPTDQKARAGLAKALSELSGPAKE